MMHGTHNVESFSFVSRTVKIKYIAVLHSKRSIGQRNIFKDMFLQLRRSVGVDGDMVMRPGHTRARSEGCQEAEIAW